MSCSVLKQTAELVICRDESKLVQKKKTCVQSQFSGDNSHCIVVISAVLRF